MIQCRLPYILTGNSPEIFFINYFLKHFVNRKLHLACKWELSERSAALEYWYWIHLILFSWNQLFNNFLVTFPPSLHSQPMVDPGSQTTCSQPRFWSPPLPHCWEGVCEMFDRCEMIVSDGWVWVLGARPRLQWSTGRGGAMSRVQGILHSWDWP